MWNVQLSVLNVCCMYTTMLSSSTTKPRRVHAQQARRKPMQRDTLASLLHAADRAGHASVGLPGSWRNRPFEYDLLRTVPTVYLANREDWCAALFFPGSLFTKSAAEQYIKLTGSYPRKMRIRVYRSWIAARLPASTPLSARTTPGRCCRRRRLPQTSRPASRPQTSRPGGRRP